MKNTIVLLIVVIVLVGPSAGQAFAGGKQEKAGAGPKQIEFHWQTLEESEEQNWRTYFLEPYMEKNPDVVINFETIPENREAFRVQLAAGAGPDIFTMDAFDIKELGDADRILSLEKYSRKYGWKSFMFDWAYNSCEYNGELYALPYAAEVTLIWYNKTFMDQYGWKVPKTRAEFEQSSQKAIGQGLMPIAYGYSGLPLLQQWLYDHYINGYAGAKKLVELLQAKTDFSDPLIQGAFQLLKDDWDRGWWNDKLSGGITINEGRALFTNGKSLFNPEGTWLAYGGIEQMGSNYEFSADAWPSMRDGVGPTTSVANGEVILVNKITKHPDVCADIFNFLYTELDTIAKGIGYGGMEMLGRDVDPSYYPEDIDPYVRLGLELTDRLMRTVDNIGYSPWGFYPNKTNQYLMDNLDRVFLDRATVAEYLAEAQEKFEEDLSDGYVFTGE
jgi:ABC-type glycerol-3-phosphate transport system substrate-binding protein